jgi:hypothetical protein
MTTNYLTLLPGTQLLLGETQTLFLPEDYGNDGLYVGDEAVLQNEQKEVLGTALVRSLVVQVFAHLQTRDFAGTAHSGLTAWHTAAETLRDLVPGFSITDRVSIIGVEVLTLLQPGFTVSASKQDNDIGVVDVPSEEQQFAGLDTLADEGAD